MSEDVAAAEVLAEETFRHSWDMSDERRIDGAWVQGLCCECGEFVPFGLEVAHVAEALAPLIAARERAAEVRGEGWGLQYAIGVMLGSIGANRVPAPDAQGQRILDLLRARRDRADRRAER